MPKYLLLVITAFCVSTAFAADDDVFLDEGNGDFDSAPAASAAPNDGVADEPVPAPSTMPSEVTLPETAPEEISAPTPEPKTWPKEGKKSAHQKAKKPEAKEPKKSAKAKKSGAKAEGFFAVSSDSCPMMPKQSASGSPMLTVKAGKKIWVEKVNKRWVRGFNKAGEPGYFSRNCMK